MDTDWLGSEPESEEEWNPLAEEFGDIALVAAAYEPSRVQDLLTEGKEVVPNAIFAAACIFQVEVLQLLLSAGGSPSWRRDGSTDLPSARKEGLNEESEFVDDHRKWPLLLYAATRSAHSEEIQGKRSAVIACLLKYGADLYALFPQPLQCPKRNLYPGQAIEEQHQSDNQREGSRCVLNAILEDGGSIKPILDNEYVKLDFRHRDPRGRTPLLSICRNSVGADADVNGVLEDLNWDTSNGGYEISPFLTSATSPSLFQIFLGSGSDPLAVDNEGKHILHHLLEAKDVNSEERPPQIQQSLKHALTQYPQLINQPDSHGTYPIHTALRRWRRYIVRNAYTEMAGLETIVEQILDANADPKVIDSRGNTALHYLADDGLMEDLHAHEQRRIFRRLLDSGIDVNIRNSDDRTALELALNDRSRAHLQGLMLMYATKDKAAAQENDAEVFEMFERAGVRWSDCDAHGQTLLHLIAKYPMSQAGFRTEYLISLKHVDPGVVDDSGKTALDLARECDNDEVVAVLEKCRGN